MMQCEKNNQPKQSVQRSRRSRRAGFTLTELMVVIVIIGILATAGFMTFQWATADAKYGKAASQISSIKEIVVRYKLKRGVYPADLEEAGASAEEKIPAEDPWGNPWIYESEDGEWFFLGADGEKVGDDTDDIYYDSDEGRIINKADGEKASDE